MFQPDDVIEGRYRLLKKIGAGAHGVVFRARDLQTRNDVAIKFLGDEVGKNPTYVERLHREALAMAQLRGTSAVYVMGLRSAPDSPTYMVMEYLTGRDLQSYLEAGESQGGKFRPDYMAQLLRPIVATLDMAHSRGIVHRDLKPSNIFVLDKSVGGGVRLLDFGLVKLLDQAGLTGQGQVAGTPSYIAPEAWKGNSLLLDHRIDVYALGVIVFRILASTVPHKSKGMVDMLNWALRGPRPSLHALRPDLNPKIDAWVQKALAIKPEDRFQDVKTLWGTLETVLGTVPKAPF
jgi:eukaryotic-like serine/threonine-protein kinase